MPDRGWWKGEREVQRWTLTEHIPDQSGLIRPCGYKPACYSNGDVDK
jgi:hypothetical protein